MRKGQLVFEFIIAGVLFIAIVLFVLNILNVNVASYTNDYVAHTLDAKAFALSELLVKNKGSWDTGTVPWTPRSVGFAEAWPYLSEEKLSNFNDYCSGNKDVLLPKFDLLDKAFGNTYKFKIVVNSTDSTLPSFVECGQAAEFPRGSIIRYAVLETTDPTKKDMPLKVFVWVW